MTLTLHRHAVQTVELGRTTGIAGGTLTVDAEALQDHLKGRDERLAEVRIGLARPGEATRIVCVKDAVQPRVKTSGSEPGTGTVCVLDNVAVVTCGPIVAFQEGVIDMSGPGADYTPFSQMPLVVLEATVGADVSRQDHEEAVRFAGLEAAAFIARSCVEAEPDTVETVAWEASPADPDLPRIAYVYLVLSQGLLHDNYVLGRNAREGLPITADPRIAFETAIVSGNCVSACDKNTTYHHQNNPVIAELLRGRGAQWDFAGMVISNASTRLADKQRSAEAAVKLVADMQVNGAIVSKEGFGNPDADLMMILRGLEQAGIAAVAITDEFAGGGGDSQSLADTVPEADAIVSVGNANERVDLPAMTTTFGPLPDVARLAGGYPYSLREDGSLEVELQAIVGSTNQLGFSRLSCREI
jgi:sarcosine reductase